jgi:hypothetical protein
MGTSLSGLTPATTFDGLLKTSDNDAITSSLKTIGSGDGTDSCLQLSDSALKVNSGAVTIVGTGATSATTSLLVQNSGGDDMFKTTDDGGTTLKSFGASNTLIIDTSGGVSGFQMNSSNGQQRFRIQGTSTATRFTPNNTNDAFTFVGNGIYTSGAFDIPSARLHIKGSGATSATTSLLVQNSAGTDMLFVTDDKIVNARSTLRVHHNSNSSRYVNIAWGSFRANDTGTEMSIYGGGYASAIFLNGTTKPTAAGATGIQSTGVLIAESVSQSSFDPEDSAQLQVDSTTKGFLPPRMTGEQRDAIESPASGLIIYNTTTNKAQCYNGSDWNDMF